MKAGMREGSHYDNRVKQNTREIWYGKFLRSERAGGIVMLAGDTPHEVHTAMRHGFRLEKITPVEHDPDSFQRFKNRFSGKERDYIRQTARCCEVSQACRDLVADGKYQRVISLDFCGNAEDHEVRAEIMGCLDSGVLKHGGKLVVEVLDGREHKMLARFEEHDKHVTIAEESQLWKLSPYIRKPMTPHEAVRLKLLRIAVESYRGRVVPIGIGKYRNEFSPMLWVIYSLEPELKGRR